MEKSKILYNIFKKYDNKLNDYSSFKISIEGSESNFKVTLHENLYYEISLDEFKIRNSNSLVWYKNYTFDAELIINDKIEYNSNFVEIEEDETHGPLNHFKHNCNNSDNFIDFMDNFINYWINIFNNTIFNTFIDENYFYSNEIFEEIKLKLKDIQ